MKIKRTKTKTEGTCPLVFCIFVVIFIFGFLVIGHFYLGFYDFELTYEKNFLQKAHFFWPFGHFCFKSGQPAKPVFMRVPGVRGHFPTFFLNLLLLKNNNIIYNWQIKVGFWPQQYLVQNLWIREYYKDFNEKILFLLKEFLLWKIIK